MNRIFQKDIQQNEKMRNKIQDSSYLWGGGGIQRDQAGILGELQIFR